MTFQQRLMVITVLAVGIAVLVLMRTRSITVSADRVSARAENVVAACLAAMACALIGVGIVSHTLLRHFIQIAPLILALGLLVRRSAVGISAAVPLFAFWLLVMGAIWLFLLGIARIFSGPFTPAEIALTLGIGVAAVFGLASARQPGAAAPVAARVGTAVIFALLQFAAMLVSVQPFAATR
jgi:hypothetical protein